MAYIHVDVDIEEYLDEVDAEYLIDELESRAKKKKMTLGKYIKEEKGDNSVIESLARTRREELAEYIGLNRFASKEDIIREILNKM